MAFESSSHSAECDRGSLSWAEGFGHI